VRVTIKEIAVKAGVSPAAVSKALNNKSDIGDATRERIIRISQELGYRPNMIARNLVKKSNNTVGVLVPDISTPIYPTIYKGINDTAIKHGYTLLLGDTKRSAEQERNYVITMMENRVSGLLISPVSNDISHIKEVVRDQVPVIFFGGKVNDTMQHYVGVDNYRGGRLATGHLIDSGHSRILMICDDLSTRTRNDRVNGYRDAMVERGLEPDVLFNDQGLTGMGCGISLVRTLLGERRVLPTALFALNDLMAIGAMQALSEAGLRVPQDMCVIGYDDLYFVSLPMISLTTIWQPKYETGEMAFEHLHHMMSGEPVEKESRRIVLQPELRIRGSTRRE
jgi:DNA-binding LacI/PurR family transcriptional regulator